MFNYQPWFVSRYSNDFSTAQAIYNFDGIVIMNSEYLRTFKDAVVVSF